MPVFFFDINDGASAENDNDGQLCADAETARREAIRTLTEIILDTLPDGANRDFSVKVSDEFGVPVFEAVMAFRSGWIGGHGAVAQPPLPTTSASDGVDGAPPER